MSHGGNGCPRAFHPKHAKNMARKGADAHPFTHGGWRSAALIAAAAGSVRGGAIAAARARRRRHDRRCRADRRSSCSTTRPTGSMRCAATSARLRGRGVDRLEALVRANRDRLEMTDDGPAVRGEVIAIDPDPAALAAVAGGRLHPPGRGADRGARPPLGHARRAARLVGRSGAVAAAADRARRPASPPTICTARAARRRSRSARPRSRRGASAGPAAIGVIDGGVAAHPSLRGAGPAARLRGRRAAAQRARHRGRVADRRPGAGARRGARRAPARRRRLRPRSGGRQCAGSGPRARLDGGAAGAGGRGQPGRAGQSAGRARDRPGAGAGHLHRRRGRQ